MKQYLFLILCIVSAYSCKNTSQPVTTNPLGDKTYGVVNLSVCNLHDKPDFSSEMITQAVMGMPVKILDFDNWYHIQTPDDYTGWVHRSAIVPMTKEDYNIWAKAEKLVVTAHYGFAYSLPDADSQTVSDVVAGNRFRLMEANEEFHKVMYPDGKQAYLPKNISQTEEEWRTLLKQDAESIIQTTFTLMGVPYLWAGTSSKGMDCSGFVRNVLYMHDIIIPRDASQQARVGKRLEITDGFDHLIPGDLIFFGRKATAENKERVVHVAIYIGDKKFIHAQGDVRIGSFNPNDKEYDEFNLNRLLFATRFLNSIGTPGINTTKTNPYYNEQ
ncbi:C40 family peptidase [Bacteroides sp. OttesenSCG-928-D19]|nr:C40 family peptidase [Bacteroides sp. OttesenSCG-928-D19]